MLCEMVRALGTAMATLEDAQIWGMVWGSAGITLGWVMWRAERREQAQCAHTFEITRRQCVACSGQDTACADYRPAPQRKREGA